MKVEGRMMGERWIVRSVYLACNLLTAVHATASLPLAKQSIKENGIKWFLPRKNVK